MRGGQEDDANARPHEVSVVLLSPVTEHRSTAAEVEGDNFRGLLSGSFVSMTEWAASKLPAEKGGVFGFGSYASRREICSRHAQCLFDAATAPLQMF